MAKKRRNTRKRLIAVLLSLLLIPAAYVGAYYGMQDGCTADLDPSGRVIPEYRPVYRVGGAMVEYALWPAHQLDRWLRPDHWAFP
jgi:hypothetical protein